jgi:hypothetical protein
VICAACRLDRAPADLLSFTLIREPEVRRYVCRPTRPAGMADGPCFARVVGPVDIHSIAFAEAPAPIAVEPVKPETPAWWELMRAAGVRPVPA